MYPILYMLLAYAACYGMTLPTTRIGRTPDDWREVMEGSDKL
jgi:hypothetical protein